MAVKIGWKWFLINKLQTWLGDSKLGKACANHYQVTEELLNLNISIFTFISIQVNKIKVLVCNFKLTAFQ